MFVLRNVGRIKWYPLLNILSSFTICKCHLDVRPAFGSAWLYIVRKYVATVNFKEEQEITSLCVAYFSSCLLRRWQSLNSFLLIYASYWTAGRVNLIWLQWQIEKSRGGKSERQGWERCLREKEREKKRMQAKQEVSPYLNLRRFEQQGWWKFSGQGRCLMNPGWLQHCEKCSCRDDWWCSKSYQLSLCWKCLLWQMQTCLL